MNGFDEQAYNQYFGKESNVSNPTQPPLNNDLEQYTYQQFVDGNQDGVETTDDIPSSDVARYIADSNMDDLDQLGELLKRILNAAWGSGWGTISPDLQTGENPDDIIFPQITLDINSRESAEKMPIKPVLTDTVVEVVNGKETGDAFNIYRQWFDCIVEFNFWARNNLEARRLMTKFESLMAAYAGHLKKQGISEIFFLKELPPRQSLNFLDGIPMRSLMYYVRFERIQSVRISTINKINMEFEVTETLEEVNSGNTSNPDYYNNSNITLNL
jgi:hypothetical protein